MVYCFAPGGEANSIMKVAVIGAGAVGLAIGAGLAAGGEKVRFVVRRKAQRDALLQRGARRSGLFGDAAAAPGSFAATCDLAALSREPDDVWLVCTKTTETDELARALAPVWQATATVPPLVLCQNGWGNTERFSAHIPLQRVFNARVITGCERIDDTSARIVVHADAIHVGHLRGVDTAPVAPVCEAIDKSGFPCALSADIAKDLWAKLLYNALLNPLGALAGVRYGALGERPETRAVMDALAHETFSVMHAAGFETHWEDADSYLETFYGALLPPTAKHESSMLRDLRAGRRTEIDPLCGAVTALAERHGVPAPLNTALLTLIRAAETRA